MTIRGFHGFAPGMGATLSFCLNEIGAHAGSGVRFSMAEGLDPRCERGTNPDNAAPNSCARAHGMTI